MTLAYGKVLQDPVIRQIAQQHGAIAAQVALAWTLYSSVTPCFRRPPGSPTCKAICWRSSCG